MIKRELSLFLIVGLLTVLVDFMTYHTLTHFHSVDLHIAKGVGFITGTLFSYFANRAWTFGDRQLAPGSLGRFTLLYASTLGMNVLVNALMLNLAQDHLFFPVHFAFLVATAVSATLNFLGMKWLVFKPTQELQ